MSPEQKSEQTQKPEKLQIPKSREIFAGDINAAVITVQKVTGVEITPDWWDQHVQKNGTVQDTNEILDNFDEAFSEYILGLEGFKAPEFSDRDLAELKAIEEIEAALRDGRLRREEDLNEYVTDLIAWLEGQHYDRHELLETSSAAILIAGSQEYIEAEKAKHEELDPLTGLVEVHYRTKSDQQLTLLGTEHIFDTANPEARYLELLVERIAQDEPRNTVFILEGQYEDSSAPILDPESAIKVSGGEFNYVRTLATIKNIGTVPGEPDPHDNAREILRDYPEITNGQIALHYALKTVAGIMSYDKPTKLSDIAPYVHHAVGMGGNRQEGGWVAEATSRDDVLNITEGTRTVIMDDMPQIVDKLNTEFSNIYPNTDFLRLNDDGTITLLYDLAQQPVLWDPSPKSGSETVISRISSLDMLLRDTHTLKLAIDALMRGEHPIIVVGNSHVSTLRPAIDLLVDILNSDG